MDETQTPLPSTTDPETDEAAEIAMRAETDEAAELALEEAGGYQTDDAPPTGNEGLMVPDGSEAAAHLEEEAATEEVDDVPDAGVDEVTLDDVGAELTLPEDQIDEEVDTPISAAAFDPTDRYVEEGAGDDEPAVVDLDVVAPAVPDEASVADAVAVDEEPAEAAEPAQAEAEEPDQAEETADEAEAAEESADEPEAEEEPEAEAEEEPEAEAVEEPEAMTAEEPEAMTAEEPEPEPKAAVEDKAEAKGRPKTRAAARRRVEEEEEEPERPTSPFDPPGDWYVIHTYAGYENKVKANLHSRIGSMQMEEKIFDVVIPMEDVMEIKGGKKQVVQRKVFPGYLLVKMFYDNDSWYVVRNTPGVTGFVSSGTGTKPTPLSRREVEKILAVKQETQVKPQYRLEWEEGDVVRIVAGPFADFTGTIAEINVEQSKLKVLVNIFDRETPVELAFDQVAKA